MAIHHTLSALALCIVWCQVIAGSGNAICNKATWKNGRLVAGAPEGSQFPYDYPTEQGWQTVHISELSDFTIDASGNIYITDAGSHNRGVVRWPPNSTLGDVLVGGGAGNWPQFGAPRSLLLTPTEDIIICDSGYNRIQRYYPKTNKTQTLISNVDCIQLFADKNDDLLFSTSNLMLFKWHSAENRIELVMKPAGKILPSKSNENRMFLSPNGNVYIADAGNDRILRYTPGQDDAEIIAGAQTWQSSRLGYLNSPVSVITDDENTLYIGNSGSGEIVRWDVADLAGDIIAKQANIGSNFMIRFDQDGNLYAASYTSIIRYDIDTSVCTRR